MNNELQHGGLWKNHKYIKKIGDRYFYADDETMKKISSSMKRVSEYNSKSDEYNKKYKKALSIETNAKKQSAAANRTINKLTNNGTKTVAWLDAAKVSSATATKSRMDNVANFQDKQATVNKKNSDRYKDRAQYYMNGVEKYTLKGTAKNTIDRGKKKVNRLLNIFKR